MFETVTEPNARYTGFFYWNAYHGCWWKIIAVRDGKWIVSECNLDGISLRKPHESVLPLDTSKFANKPFDVKAVAHA